MFLVAQKRNCGKPHVLQALGLRFQRNELVVELLEALALMSDKMIHSRANGFWNKSGRLPLHNWLSRRKMDQCDKNRLEALGNVVMPRCGQLGLHLMGHAVQKDCQFSK